MYDEDGTTDMPPITSMLAGMIKIKESTSKRDKEMLMDILTDKHFTLFYGIDSCFRGNDKKGCHPRESGDL